MNTRLFKIMLAAVMMALVNFTACIEDDVNGDEDENGDGNGKKVEVETLSFSGKKETTYYTLTITANVKTPTNPGQAGDNYTLVSSSKTSAGSVTSVKGNDFTLKPSNSSTSFTATVSGANLTALTGTITWKDNSTEQGPGSFAPGGEEKPAEWILVKNSPAQKKVFNCIIFANDVFVAGAGGGIIAYSKDGVEWKAADPLISTFPFINGKFTGNVNSIAYGNGTFVAVGDGATIWTSTDGISWQEERPQVDSKTNPDMFCPIHMTPGRFNNVAFGNGKFVACMSTYYNYVRIGWSTDGKNWNRIGNVYDDAIKHPDVYQLFGLTFFNGKFIICGNRSSGDIGWLSHSDNGWDWSVPQKHIEFQVTAQTAVGNNRIIIVEGEDVLRSSDGMNWTKSNPKPTGNLFRYSSAYDCIAFGNGKWVAGFMCDIVYSTDNGDTWKGWERSPFFNEELYDSMEDYYDWNDYFGYIYGMAYGKGRFVAVGSNGEIAYSPIQ